MNGRHTAFLTALPRRLWARFEVLPFRYGVALVVGALAAMGLLVGGIVTSGGEDRPVRHAPSRPPVEAAMPPAPTLGAYVPPRKADPTPVPARPRVASVPPSAPPAHAAPRSSPTLTCPPALKRWTWLWEMCKHKRDG